LRVVPITTLSPDAGGAGVQLLAVLQLPLPPVCFQLTVVMLPLPVSQTRRAATGPCSRARG